jgi:hypothetical protein
MTAVLPEIQIADYSEWEPKDYLADYYREIAPDERYAMEFLVESLRRTPEVPVALEFGCGPTLHHASRWPRRPGKCTSPSTWPATATKCGGGWKTPGGARLA